MTDPQTAEAATTFFGIAIHPWKIIGLTGSFVFGIRFFLQWIASERAKKSIIPFGFWECSTIGCLLTLSYFAFYQKDSVGVIQSLLPLPIYLRNLYFRYKKGSETSDEITQEKKETVAASRD
jgi:lipid-A-disaccharide synthase-like uncharacterized protein